MGGRFLRAVMRTSTNVSTRPVPSLYQKDPRETVPGGRQKAAGSRAAGAGGGDPERTDRDRIEKRRQSIDVLLVKNDPQKRNRFEKDKARTDAVISAHRQKQDARQNGFYHPLEVCKAVL